jgi:ABC-type xylose transport system permease subunit
MAWCLVKHRDIFTFTLYYRIKGNIIIIIIIIIMYIFISLTDEYHITTSNFENNFF